VLPQAEAPQGKSSLGGPLIEAALSILTFRFLSKRCLLSFDSSERNNPATNISEYYFLLLLKEA
jgi:hypothetical protein